LVRNVSLSTIFSNTLIFCSSLNVKTKFNTHITQEEKLNFKQSYAAISCHVCVVWLCASISFGYWQVLMWLNEFAGIMYM
jgi:hypothetical protein